MHLFQIDTKQLQANGVEFDFITNTWELDIIEGDLGPFSGSGLESGSSLGSGQYIDILELYTNLSIMLPSIAFDQDDDQYETGIFLSLYLITSLFPTPDENFVLGSPIIAASVAEREVSDLTEPVVITLQALAGSVSLPVPYLPYACMVQFE